MIAESTVTAALVAVIIVLTKVIEWLMQRAKDAKEAKKAASPYNGHCPHAHNLEKVVDKLDAAADKLVVVADRLDRDT
jgi:hypothetical protein